MLDHMRGGLDSISVFKIIKAVTQVRDKTPGPGYLLVFDLFCSFNEPLTHVRILPDGGEVRI